MRPHLFTLLSAVSLLMCIATAFMWVRSRWHDDIGQYTTAPYDGYVQHTLGCLSGHGRIWIQLDSDYEPRLLVSNGWGGFQEEYIAIWGWNVRSSWMEIPEPWPWWGGGGWGQPSRLGFAGEIRHEKDATSRSFWIPYYFPVLLTAAMPCLWIRRRYRRAKMNRRRLKGLCPACGYDVRASPARCSECGKTPDVVELPAARNRVPMMAALAVITALCAAVGLFWHFDSRERPEVVLAPEAIPAALKPGMREYEVDAIINRPRFELRNFDPSGEKCNYLSDGSTLICSYEKGKTWASYPGDGNGVLNSFQRVRFEELERSFPAELFPAVRIVHLAPSGDANVFDSISLIRAVNGLQKLGKPMALAALRAYVTLAGEDSARPIRYGIDARRAFFIARILFGNPGDQPEALAGRFEFPYADAMADPRQWPQYPLILQNDIPFCMDLDDEHSFDRDSAERIPAFLDRCHQVGIMRETALSPSSTPFDAVEAAAKHGSWPRHYLRVTEVDLTLSLLRIQAIRAASPLFVTLKNEDWTCLQETSKETSDKVWSHFLHEQRLKRMRWDPARQQFVIADR